MTKVEQQQSEEKKITPETPTLTLGEAADIFAMTRIRAMVEEEIEKKSSNKTVKKSRV